MAVTRRGAMLRPPTPPGAWPVMRAWRRRLALVTTDSDEAAMAAAAMVGDSTIPKNGYSSPAATGMPMVLYPR